MGNDLGEQTLSESMQGTGRGKLDGPGRAGVRRTWR